VTPDGSKRKTSSKVVAKTDETDQQLLEQELRALMKERKVKLNLKEFNSRYDILLLFNELYYSFFTPDEDELLRLKASLGALCTRTPKRWT